MQSFLFSARTPRWRRRKDRPDEPDAEPFRLFRRDDIGQVVVEIENRNEGRKQALHLSVERLNLYLFRSGSAILVLEVSNAGLQSLMGWSLADVLDFHDVFRRAYMPFAAAGRDGSLTPTDLAVRSVTWHLGKAARSQRFEISDELAGCAVAEHIAAPPLDDDTRGRRFAPVFAHWRELLRDTLPLAPNDTLRDPRWREGEGRWHHILDERMATLATVSVCGSDDGDARFYFDRTRRGDLVRLCFADRFSRDAYPYDPHFLRQFEKENVYDRFRQDGTLYLASGYAFVAYGAGGFFETVIAAHVRRHYFQMGLLAHFELASLLAFSGRVSRAVEHYGDNPEAFERHMLDIENEFLQFLHRFRFTGVSNHLQAQELFDLWRRHLRLREVFDDLRQELASATDYLFNRAASRSARMGERLSAIATLGLVLGLAFSLAGMNLVFDSELTGEKAWLHSHLRQTALVLAIVVGFAWLGFGALKMLRRVAEPPPRRRVGRSPLGALVEQLRRHLYRPRGRPAPRSFSERFERRLFWVTAGASLLAALFMLAAWIAG